MATQREQKDKVHPFIENLFVTIFTAVSSLVVVKWNMRTKLLNKKISSSFSMVVRRDPFWQKLFGLNPFKSIPSTQKLREIAWLLKVRGAYNLGKKILKESSTTNPLKGRPFKVMKVRVTISIENEVHQEICLRSF